MVRMRGPGLLLGEWACLAALASGPRHGFAVAKRLEPEGEFGRVWTLSRPLTYRSLASLQDHGLIRPRRSEPGVGGPNRTVLAITAAGRRALDEWLSTPVGHPRDVRGELLLKIVVLAELGRTDAPLIADQLAVFERQRVSRLAELAEEATDPVRRWRLEFLDAAIRFLRSREGG
jgi:DNA-binding PadR family transcriptional regulator